MKILVSVKRVIDYTVKIKVKSDGSGVETANIKMSMNPFDEIALEEAIRMIEAKQAEEVIAVTIGNEESQEVLRSALARGAGKAIHIKTNEALSSLTIARILAKIVEQEKPQLVLMGKQAIDDDNQQTGQMLAGLLNWPQATYASQIKIENGQCQVSREVDEGLEVVDIKLPAVITTDLRLNEPRYINLPNIIKAKQKTITQITLEELNITPNKTLQVLETFSPPIRKTGIKVPDVKTLIYKLHDEAKVI